MKIKDIVIGNTEYFFALENVIRNTWEGFPAYEEHILLPVAEAILRDSGILDAELIQYPIEGYYYKTDGLKRYFTIIRNLQINPKVIKRIDVSTASFAIILRVCSCPLFGPEIEERLKLDDGSEVKKILPRRRDILSHCLADDDVWHHSIEPRPYDIEKIWKIVGDYKYGYPNLVELGYLTGNLLCMACAAESNMLYRELYGYSGYSGSTGYRGKDETIYYRIVWKVDSTVEKMGTALIGEYNKLMAFYLPETYTGNRILGTLVSPEATFVYGMDRKIEQPRIARLAYCLLDGANYSWLINGCFVKDFYSYKVITTNDILTNYDLRRAIIEGSYKDTVEDCNTPELFRLGKLPNTIFNKLKGFEV